MQCINILFKLANEHQYQRFQQGSDNLLHKKSLILTINAKCIENCFIHERGLYVGISDAECMQGSNGGHDNNYQNITFSINFVTIFLYFAITMFFIYNNVITEKAYSSILWCTHFRQSTCCVAKLCMLY